jgi:hypothetical protein
MFPKTRGCDVIFCVCVCVCVCVCGAAWWSILTMKVCGATKECWAQISLCIILSDSNRDRRRRNRGFKSGEKNYSWELVIVFWFEIRIKIGISLATVKFHNIWCRFQNNKFSRNALRNFEMKFRESHPQLYEQNAQKYKVKTMWGLARRNRGVLRFWLDLECGCEYGLKETDDVTSERNMNSLPSFSCLTA